jgi:hypothetical protein
MYGCETWAHSQKGMNKIQTAEMRFLRKVKGCTGLDIIIKEDIRADLNIYRLSKQIEDHINRMEDHRLLKQSRKCKPKGKMMLIDP